MGKARFLAVGTAGLGALDSGENMRHIEDVQVVQCGRAQTPSDVTAKYTTYSKPAHFVIIQDL